MTASRFFPGLVLVGALCGCAPGGGAPTSAGSSSGAGGSSASGSGGSGGATSGSGGDTSGSGGSTGTGTGGSAGAGTGGSAGAGVGGSAGAGGTAGGGGSGGGQGIACTGSELFCEDFEDEAVGQPPGAPWIPYGDSCQYQTTFSSEVSTDLVHTGSNAFKMTNHSQEACRASVQFADADDYWVRAFIYWDPAVDFTNKETLAIDIHGASGLHTNGPTIRFGTRTKEPCTGSAGPQITLMAIADGEQTGCNGTVAEPKGEWFCFEAHVQQATNVVVKTYINGEGFTYESVGKEPTETIETPVGSPPVEKMNHLRLGFFTHDSSGQGNVYVDDVAVATTRLGCGN